MHREIYHYTFSNDAQIEVLNYIKLFSKFSNIEQVKPLDHGDCPKFTLETEELRAKLETTNPIIIIKPFINLEEIYNIFERRLISWFIGNILGEPLVQNEAGHKVICVYDRDRTNSMKTGARYHQTREGGTIHTDNVNVPYKWEYLILSCISPAMSGGENILVDGARIYNILKSLHLDALNVLERNFLWEQRGVSDSTYEAPIITYGLNGEPLFRHLRPYMESAHLKHDMPLTDEQVYAIDTLDSLIEHSKNQFRHTFIAGEILLTYDSQVLHGRTCFSDALNAVDINIWAQNKNLPLKRTMDRIWSKKRGSHTHDMA